MDIDTTENIETPYRDAEIDTSKINLISVRNTIRKITEWQWLTHHPQCSRYENHYFTVGKYKICVGCTMLYIGWGLVLLLYLMARTLFTSSPWILIIAYFSGIVGSLAHVALKPEKKWIKAVSRGFLGVTFGAYTIGIILAPNWWIRILMVATMAAPVKFYNFFRGKNKSYEYCMDCPMVDLDPSCQPFVNTHLRVKAVNLFVQGEIARLKEESQAKTAKLMGLKNSTNVDVDLTNNKE